MSLSSDSGHFSPRRTSTASRKTSTSSRRSSRSGSGKQLRFRKGELIGGGGYGDVFLGMDVADGRLIAIKQVDRGRHAAEAVEALKGEVSYLKTFDHPRIVRYLGVASTERYVQTCSMPYQIP